MAALKNQPGNLNFSASKKRSRMHRHSFYKHEANNIVIFRIKLKDIAKFFLGFAPTMERAMNFVTDLVAASLDQWPSFLTKADKENYSVFIFHFADVHLLNTKNFHGGVTALDFFL